MIVKPPCVTMGVLSFRAVLEESLESSGLFVFEASPFLVELPEVFACSLEELSAGYVHNPARWVATTKSKIPK